MIEVTSITAKHIGWLAGLLSTSKASFGLSNKGIPPSVHLTLIDQDTVEHYARIVGGAVVQGTLSSPKQKGKYTPTPAWSCALYGPDAVQLMELVYPKMSPTRQAEIRWCLAECGVGVGK